MTDVKTSLEQLGPGARLGHYAVGRKLGEGGMGVVFVAEDTRLRRTVALKILPEVSSDSERRYRFLREGRLAAGLTHPCIATVYEVGEVDERVFIAMELVEGRSVGRLLKESPEHRLRPFAALRIAREVARGLVKAHEAGIIHRDLKPDNVMYGEDQVVKILDFGVAKRTEDPQSEVVTAHATKQGSLIGTPDYMSPEQAAGRAVDARSDIFSLGVMLYEMLTGVRPFQGETWQEIIISVARDPLVPPSEHRPDLSATLDALLLRCLAKRPDERFPSARALLEQLEVLLLDTAVCENLSDAVAAIAVSQDRLVLTSDVRVALSETERAAAEGRGGPPEFAAAAPSTSGWLVPALGVVAGVGLVVGVASFVLRRPSTVSTASSSVAGLPAAAAASSPPVESARAAAPGPTASATEVEAAASATPVPTSPAAARRSVPAVSSASRPTATALPVAPPPPAPAAKTSKQNPVLGF
ncbi:MAG: serine/threonine protein kinase [Deltaproteobacteria bacterium]|nr:serine/threonine protein kinase [Deltaproteobacteria bacterium]